MCRRRFRISFLSISAPANFSAGCGSPHSLSLFLRSVLTNQYSFGVMFTQLVRLLLFMALSTLPRTVIAFHSSSKRNAFSSINKLFRMSSTSSSSSSSSNQASLSAIKRVLVPIAQDSEEIETSCITDTLTRFGAQVVVASVQPDGNLVCKMSRGLKVMADVTIEDAAKEDWDLIALPGGMPGANHLRDCHTLISLLKRQQTQGKYYGAICASPAVVLAHHHLVSDSATCYPADGLRSKMSHPVDQDVVVQKNVITSKGPGTSLLFALKLGELLYGKQQADKIAKDMLVYYH